MAFIELRAVGCRGTRQRRGEGAQKRRRRRRFRLQHAQQRDHRRRSQAVRRGRPVVRGSGCIAAGAAAASLGGSCRSGRRRCCARPARACRPRVRGGVERDRNDARRPAEDRLQAVLSRTTDLVLSELCGDAHPAGTGRSGARDRRLEPRPDPRGAPGRGGAAPIQRRGVSSSCQGVALGPAVLLDDSGEIVLVDCRCRWPSLASRCHPLERSTASSASTSGRLRT